MSNNSIDTINNIQNLMIKVNNKIDSLNVKNKLNLLSEDKKIVEC